MSGKPAAAVEAALKYPELPVFLARDDDRNRSSVDRSGLSWEIVR
ncbi:MAG: hypothetical protein ACE5JN_03395 [Candidatus Methylomirabilia bacterium]